MPYTMTDFADIIAADCRLFNDKGLRKKSTDENTVTQELFRDGHAAPALLLSFNRAENLLDISFSDEPYNSEFIESCKGRKDVIITGKGACRISPDKGHRILGALTPVINELFDTAAAAARSDKVLLAGRDDIKACNAVTDSENVHENVHEAMNKIRRFIHRAAGKETLTLEDTERLTERKERCGQSIYREAMLSLWEGACAVTGVSVPCLLRASHAVPWSECESAFDRISPFNGFLLTPALDILFDGFLISFDDDGKILIADSLNGAELAALGIDEHCRLRFVLPEHLPYLNFHRQKFFSDTIK